MASVMDCDRVLRVGVLAVQGDFAEHKFHLEQAYMGREESRRRHLEVVEVKTPAALEGLEGLIIPGGESTTIGHFLQKNSFREKLLTWMKGLECSRPPVVWGTCAGLILLADKVTDQKLGGQYTLGGIGVTACRNMYGRQQASFEAPLHLYTDKLAKGISTCHGVFIRAPGIQSVDSKHVLILATHTNTEGKNIPVAVEQGNLMASSFHPELTDDLRWHDYFLHKISHK